MARNDTREALCSDCDDEIWAIVTRTRLTVGYCAHEKVTLVQSDLEKMYEDLLRLSVLLTELKAEVSDG